MIGRLMLVCVLVSSPALAGPIAFGSSWDGTPPGSIADVSGLSGFQLGTCAISSRSDCALDAGTYVLTFGGSFTAWRDLTTIRDGRGDLIVAPGALPVAPLTLTEGDPWWLTAETPSVTDARSTDQQWAFVPIGPDLWAWGLEDIAIGVGDGDYQDLFGKLQRVRDPQPRDPDPTPAPEPITIALVGAGLVVARWQRRTSKAVA